LVTYSKDLFLKHWLPAAYLSRGFILAFFPTQIFKDIDSEKDTSLAWNDLLRYLLPFKKPLFKFTLTMLVGSLISLIFPFLTQAVVDKGIKHGDLNLILLLLIAQLLLTIGQFGNEMLRSWLMLHITMKMNISFIFDFLSKLTRLSLSFFDVKKIGDIMQRIADNSRIQSFMTSSLISIIVAGVTFIIYSVIMAGYDKEILYLFLLGSVVYVLWVFLFLSKRKKLDAIRFQSLSSNQSNLIQLITGMQEIKLNNCEETKLNDWKQIQMNIYKINIQSKGLEQIQGIGGMFVDQVKNLIISYWAARLVVEGNMTLGMMMAMQYVIGQLNAPLKQFISFVQNMQDAHISLERMGEIYSREDEVPLNSVKIKEIPSTGDITFKDVSFQYEGPESEKVLDKVSFTIQTGKVNAIVGTSGSGKTTILKLLLGYYTPQEGDILLAGKSLFTYNINSWREKCGIVMQEGYIFSDTIEKNINLRGMRTDVASIRYASYVANIDEFIKSLPSGYETQIGMEGSGISTGQRQRILIARAVYKNPQYIFLLDGSRYTLMLSSYFSRSSLLKEAMSTILSNFSNTALRALKGSLFTAFLFLLRKVR
jgi:ATP-binding cassette subfamily B protein